MLHVLVVEDSESDALLVLHELRAAGFELRHERVWTPDALAAALDRRAWDLLLSDYRLPTFSGLDALRLVKARDLDIPFILVSGAVGEEVAVEAMKAGAHDYVMKDRLARLGPAVRRELKEVEVRRARREAEAGLKKLCEELERRVREEVEERQRMFVHLLRGQKLQAIGQLAAGVAHEVNNPVAWILSNLGFLETRVRDPELAEAIRESKEGAARIRDIVAGLRSFARADEGEPGACALAEILERAIKLAGGELKYKAEVTRDFAELPPVPGHPRQLEQVFINLLVNAAQAIPVSGEVKVSLAREGKEAVVRIRDSGTGIPPEHQRRLFEPFFTTKPVGKGTGLGLHVAYKIVRAHGGKIAVASTPGEGTEVRVSLPLRRRRPVVVLVEDDPERMNALRRTLRGEPLQLLATGDPRQALEWLGERDVRLVLASGPSLLEEVARRSPETRRLLLGGGPEEARGGAVEEVIPKGWDEIRLREAVRAVMEER